MHPIMVHSGVGPSVFIHWISGKQNYLALNKTTDYTLRPFLTQALHDVNRYIYHAKLHISPCCVKIKLLINILSIKQFIIMIFPEEK